MLDKGKMPGKFTKYKGKDGHWVYERIDIQPIDTYVPAEPFEEAYIQTLKYPTNEDYL